MERIYFDHNATSPLRPAARAALLATLDAGNASSVHAEGRAARGLIEKARMTLARHFGVKPEVVVFASGATEAANMVLRPALAGMHCENLLIGGGEHPCVTAGHGFSPEAVAPVALTQDGRLDLDDLGAKLAGRGTPMLALQAANNETGAIQPVAEAAALVHDAGGLVVCDAVQAFGRVDCSFAATGADVILVSSHKIGGPKGVGAAIFARRAVMPKTPRIRGGGQERGHRGGTENVSAIAGFGAAVEAVLAGGDEEMTRLRAMRDRIEAGLRDLAPEAVIFAEKAPGSPIPWLSLCRGWRRKRWSRRWMSRAWRFPRVRPVPRARWRPPPCWPPWASRRTSRDARCESRSAGQILSSRAWLFWKFWLE